MGKTHNKFTMERLSEAPIFSSAIAHAAVDEQAEERGRSAAGAVTLMAEGKPHPAFNACARSGGQMSLTLWRSGWGWTIAPREP
jgi:hypothetical protein